MLRPILLFLTFFSCLAIGDAQPARLLNSSFEGEPRDATIPRGWYECMEGTTPDILPGPWGVYLEPYDGETYVGLITRENGTWEAIGQKLSKALEPNVCHYLRLALARSDTYMGYDQPLKLRIWAGMKKCDRDQLLVESQLIESTEWETFTFQFTPEKKFKYIIVEAFHKEGRFSYAGNILIDDISAIRQCGRAMLIPR